MSDYDKYVLKLTGCTHLLHHRNILQKLNIHIFRLYPVNNASYFLLKIIESSMRCS